MEVILVHFIGSKMMEKNVDPAEIAKFSQLSQEWWDPEGKLKTLHDINKLRLEFIHQHDNLADLEVVDVGCGGGILAENLAKSTKRVLGIDQDTEALKVATEHRPETMANLDYQAITAEELAEQSPASYDCVTCLEMLEHVPDPSSIVQACARLVKPGGSVYFSTINRNLKSYGLAIVGAEYLLKILPKGTHDYSKFITPAELSKYCRQAGLEITEITGMSYNPFTRQAKLVDDVDVNYLLRCELK